MDPNSLSYSVIPNYGLFKQFDQMATMMSCQQEAISKFLKENEGIKVIGYSERRDWVAAKRACPNYI